MIERKENALEMNAPALEIKLSSVQVRPDCGCMRGGESERVTAYVCVHV